MYSYTISQADVDRLYEKALFLLRRASAKQSLASYGLAVAIVHTLSELHLLSAPRCDRFDIVAYQVFKSLPDDCPLSSS